MRRAALVIALTACGDNQAAKSDGHVAVDASATCQPTSGTRITMRLVATTQGGAMLVTSPPDDARRFVVVQDGRIEIIKDGQIGATPFLDLTADAGGPVVAGGELGLLGLAFHPDYAHDGTFFVFYTTDNANVLARYRVDPLNPDRADPGSGVVVLSIADFASNHNGGMIEFGPDGYLYIGTGDGGGGGDPMLNGQNTFALLGKMLRLDVDHPAPGKEYGIPSTNPFADGVAGAPEAYIVGTRNPWRWSFDRGTGDLWIGDVGQNLIEELDRIPAGTPPGTNLGWSMYEGDSCFRAPCDPAGRTMPQFEKNHADGWCAIIGGQVYRGSCYSDLVGTYFFSDYCAHVLTTAVPRTDGTLDVQYPDTYVVDSPEPPRPGFPDAIASLHATSDGELYLTTVTCCGSSLTGGVFHLEASP